MFKTYSSMQYLAIDVANQYGLDKLTFEDRIQWVKDNSHLLNYLTIEAEEPELYYKAVRALKDAQAGKPIGHTVALDSVCSGLQLMSTVMGCQSGCEMTGLINPNKRSDAYTEITDYMNTLLDSEIRIARKGAKEAVMTGLYGSKRVPRRVFTEHIDTFYQALDTKCPGAVQLLSLLRESWNEETLAHSFTMPDGYYVLLPTMQAVETRVHIDGLKYTPVVTIKVNQPSDYGISNIANVTHAIDAYVLRTMIRRCNYNLKDLWSKREELLSYKPTKIDTNHVWFKTKIADLTMPIEGLPQEAIDKLLNIIDMCLSHKPFGVVTVHDSFACHPNHCNQLRFHYKEILAELAESTLIDDILNQLYGDEDTVTKLGDVAHLIRQSNYGLC